MNYQLTPSAVTQGAGTGLLVALLFSLVPLLDVRHVKPSRLLRDETATGGRDWVRWAAAAGVGGAVVALTMWQAGSVRIGGIVAVGFAVLAAVLYAAGIGLIASVRPLAAAGWFPLRHAALQLTRPGGQVHLVLLTVGLGTFFILGVRALQENLVSEVSVDLATDAPDMFLLDIQSDQLGGVIETLSARRPAGAPEPRTFPVLRARVVGVQGQEVTLDDYEDVRGRGSLAREYTVTYRSHLEANERIVDGAAWDGTPSSGGGEVSIEESIRTRFGIQVGDTMRFDVIGRTVAATVTSVRHVDWSDGRAGGFMFVFRPGLLDTAPHGHIAFVRGPDAGSDRARLLGDLAGRFPNVSVIDGREMLTALKAVVDNVTLAVTVVGTLVVVSGLLILVGAVAMTKFRRVYEAAILKTLGATRRVIATMLLLEYAVLGLLAGALGALGAAGLTWALSRYAFDMAVPAGHHLVGGRHRPHGHGRGPGRRGRQLGRVAAEAPGYPQGGVASRRGAACYDRELPGRRVRAPWSGNNERRRLQGRLAEETCGAVRGGRRQTHPELDGAQQRAPGRHGRSGHRQQRSPHHVEAEADRRQDPPGHRRSAGADRQGRLRRVPRLRRADCRGPAERHSVDARLHHLQGEAKGVTPSDLSPLLREFYVDRLAVLQRHVASARLVTDYDVNNAYQYVVAREETHVYWVHRALLDAGGTVPAEFTPTDVASGSVRDIAGGDAAANQAFVDKWAPRVDTVTHARHRKMLQVILGEMQEHRRLFAQAAEGRTDVIGVPLAGTQRTGVVLDTRWVE